MSDDGAWGKKPPYQPVYWGDFHMSTQTMSDDAAHAYCFLLGRAWEDGGYLKNDDRFLAKASRMATKRWKRVRGEVLEKFKLAEDGRLYNPRTLSDYQKAVKKRSKLAQNATARWSKKSNEINDHGDAIASDLHMPPTPRIEESEYDRDSESNGVDRESDTNVTPIGDPPIAKYAFNGRVIQLNQKDYDTWKKRFSAAFTDFDACLQSADDWIRKQDDEQKKKWFFIVSGMLRKKHEKALQSQARHAVSECLL